MAREDRRFLQGTLDILVLQTLSWGPMHGYGIAHWIENRTDDALPIEDGSLSPALHRMEEYGWLASEWGPSETNRKAKYYKLTPPGRKQLRAEARDWKRVSVAIARVLEAL